MPNSINKKIPISIGLWDKYVSFQGMKPTIEFEYYIAHSTPVCLNKIMDRQLLGPDFVNKFSSDPYRAYIAIL